MAESPLDTIINMIRGGSSVKETEAGKSTLTSAPKPAASPRPDAPRPSKAPQPNIAVPKTIAATVSTASAPILPASDTAKNQLPAPIIKPEYKSEGGALTTSNGELTGADVQNMIAKGEISTFGELLTTHNGSLKIPDQSRQICALFDTGLFVVSESHGTSPLVSAVAAQARRSGLKVYNPSYVTPDLIRRLYQLYDREKGGKIDTNSVKRSLERVLQAAVDLNANDIHIEASDGRTKIQLRIDGTLRVWENWTQDEGERMLSAAFSYADVASGATANWNEPMAATLSPSTGEDKIRLPKFVGGVRCQWMPLAGGRYLNMRVNYDGGAMLGTSIESADMDSLGFNEEQVELVKYLRNVPGAMRVIAGPTNQGKTTTLRVMLNRRMFETDLKLNCLVIEDPPEGGVIGAQAKSELVPRPMKSNGSAPLWKFCGLPCGLILILLCWGKFGILNPLQWLSVWP